MQVFLTGGTGYVGGAILRALLSAEHEVTVLSRSGASDDRLKAVGARPVRGDLREPATLERHAAEHEATIHAARDREVSAADLDPPAVRAMLEAAITSPKARTFVYTSGTYVLGDTSGRTVDESMPVRHPAQWVAWRPAVEQRVLKADGQDVACAVVRPGFVYGGRSGGLEPYYRMAERDGVVKVVGEGTNHWSMVHREDMARLYVRVIEEAASGVFHAVDERPIEFREMARRAGELVARNIEIQHMDRDDAREKMGPYADALALDQHVAAARSRRVLFWQPRYEGFPQGALETETAASAQTSSRS